jgi:outer membrane autotransporter protein
VGDAHAKRRQGRRHPVWALALFLTFLGLVIPLGAQGAVRITFNPEPPSTLPSSATSVNLTIAIETRDDFAPESTCTFDVTVVAQAEDAPQESVQASVTVPPGGYSNGEIIDTDTVAMPVNQDFRDAGAFTVALTAFSRSCDIILNDNGSEDYPVELDTDPRLISIGRLGVQQGLTERQRTVAETLDNACGALRRIPEAERTSRQNDLLAVCEVAEDASIAPAIYDGLAPEEVAAQGRASLQTMRQQMANVSTRLDEVRAGAGGVSTRGLNIALYGESLPVGLVANALGGGASSDILAFSQWGVFVNGSASHSRRDSSEAEPGFRRRSYGLTTGVDYRLTDDTVVGTALGFTRTDTDLRDNAGGVDVDGYSLSLYGTRFLADAFYVDGIATVGRNRYDTVRTVFSEPIGTQSALAKPKGNEYGLGLNAGYDRSRGPWTTSYQASLDYLRTEIDGYTERPSHPDNLGAGALLHIDSQTIESQTAEAAVQLSYASSQSWGVMHYSGRVGLEHEFGDRSRQIKAQFQEDPTNTTFSLRTDSPDRTYLNIGTGLTAQMARGRAAYLFLETIEGRSGYSHYQIDVGFRLEF